MEKEQIEIGAVTNFTAPKFSDRDDRQLAVSPTAKRVENAVGGTSHDGLGDGAESEPHRAFIHAFGQVRTGHREGHPKGRSSQRAHEDLEVRRVFSAQCRRTQLLVDHRLCRRGAPVFIGRKQAIEKHRMGHERLPQIRARTKEPDEHLKRGAIVRERRQVRVNEAWAKRQISQKTQGALRVCRVCHCANNHLDAVRFLTPFTGSKRSAAFGQALQQSKRVARRGPTDHCLPRGGRTCIASVEERVHEFTAPRRRSRLRPRTQRRKALGHPCPRFIDAPTTFRSIGKTQRSRDSIRTLRLVGPMLHRTPEIVLHRMLHTTEKRVTVPHAPHLATCGKAAALEHTKRLKSGLDAKLPMATTPHEAEPLNEELRFANAPDRKLHVAFVAVELAPRTRKHVLQIVEDARLHGARVDERCNGLQGLVSKREVSRHWTCAKPHRPLPRLRRRFEVPLEGCERNDHRRLRAVRTQTQVHGPRATVTSHFVEERCDDARHLHVECM